MDTHTHNTVTLSYCVTPAAAEVKSALRGERGETLQARTGRCPYKVQYVWSLGGAEEGPQHSVPCTHAFRRKKTTVVVSNLCDSFQQAFDAPVLRQISQSTSSPLALCCAYSPHHVLVSPLAPPHHSQATTVHVEASHV